MVQPKPLPLVLTNADLPETDNRPVDNELQILVPILLLAILSFLSVRYEPFEVYRLVNGSYVRSPGNPVWMPEVGLGIGYVVGQHEGLTREWLYWYDERGRRYPAPQDVIAQERELCERAEQQLTQTEQQLPSAGTTATTGD